jgi:hypothetical protein
MGAHRVERHPRQNGVPSRFVVRGDGSMGIHKAFPREIAREFFQIGGRAHFLQGHHIGIEVV